MPHVSLQTSWHSVVARWGTRSWKAGSVGSRDQGKYSPWAGTREQTFRRTELRACMRERETETEEDEGRVRECRYRRTVRSSEIRNPENFKTMSFGEVLGALQFIMNLFVRTNRIWTRLDKQRLTWRGKHTCPDRCPELCEGRWDLCHHHHLVRHSGKTHMRVTFVAQWKK